MSFLKLPNREDLSGEPRDIFDDTVERWGYVPNISRAYMLNTDVMKAEDVWCKGVMYQGLLPRALKEAIATTVSAVNDCNYCASSHAHAYTLAGGDEATAKSCKMLDFSNFNEREKAALNFTRKAARDAKTIQQEDIDQLLEHYSQAEIVEISAVIQQFMGYNWFVTILGLELEEGNTMKHVALNAKG